jgi:hypothetical protein
MVCEFTLTNTDTGHSKRADLLIDDGCQKELILPAYDALRLGLRKLQGEERITGATGDSGSMTKFSPVCVTCTLTNPKSQERAEKQEWLSVYVWSDGLAAAQKKVDDRESSEAALSSDSPGVETPQEATSLAETEHSPKKRTKKTILISPVTHKFDHLQSAILGKPGLAKLKLIVDPARDKLYMLFDDDCVFFTVNTDPTLSVVEASGMHGGKGGTDLA